MKKIDVINKVNELMKEIFKNEMKAQHFCELCREHKINTTYGNNVLIRVKKNITMKELDLLIDIIGCVL